MVSIFLTFYSTFAFHAISHTYIQTELQALQDLQKTSEEMCSSLSSKHIEAEKQLKRLLSENKTLAESIKDEKEARNHLQASYTY